MKIRIGPRQIELGQVAAKIRRVAQAAAFSRNLDDGWAVFGHYVKRTAPEIVRFKNGLELELSSHPHDLVTLFVVFCFKDYGTVAKGSRVLDIGGNIGVFSVFAAQSGASRVDVYEPNIEAYEVLVRNVARNSLQDKVFAHNMAVGATAGHGSIPAASSPYNRVKADAETSGGDVQSVRIASISDVLTTLDCEVVDLVKLDCEGAEFEICLALDEELAPRVGSIRMEYEPDQGSISAVKEHLGTRGFRVNLESTRPNRVWLAKYK